MKNSISISSLRNLVHSKTPTSFTYDQISWHLLSLGNTLYFCSDDFRKLYFYTQSQASDYWVLFLKVESSCCSFAFAELAYFFVSSKIEAFVEFKEEDLSGSPIRIHVFGNLDGEILKRLGITNKEIKKDSLILLINEMSSVFERNSVIAAKSYIKLTSVGKFFSFGRVSNIFDTEIPIDVQELYDFKNLRRQNTNALSGLMLIVLSFIPFLADLIVYYYR